MARFLKDRHKTKGAAPGSLIFIGQQKVAQRTVQLIRYTPDGIKESAPSAVDKIRSAVSDDHITWINVSGVHDTDFIAQLGNAFNISPLILEDIVNTDQRPRFSEETDHLYIIAKSFYIGDDDRRVHMEQISMIVGEHYLITIQETDREYFDDVKKRLREGKTRIRTFGADYLCYALLDTLVDSYIINLERLGAAIEDEGKSIFAAEARTVQELYHFKTELSYIRKNVRPFKEITSRFANCDSPVIDQRTYTYLRDLDDLVLQAQEAIEIYYAMVSDQINLFQTNVSNKSNDVMKVLTIFSTIFIPLTFIAGIYGMNFDYMPELHYRPSYFILLGIMLLVTLLMLLFFKRKKWL